MLRWRRDAVHAAASSPATSSPALLPTSLPARLQLRLSRALPVQGANLALALHRLPHAYTATLGHLDTAHVLLLGLLLVAGAGGALLLAREQERRMREAWLLRRMRRLADTLDVAQRSSNSGSQCSLASSQGRRAR